MQFVMFDCDGVIIDSNLLKMNAFEDAVKEYDVEHIAILLEYNRVNGGISRHEKFRYFFTEVLNLNSQEANELTQQKSQQFNQYCLKHFPTLNLTAGFNDYINYLNQNHIPCFIISGGNKDEIDLLLSHKGMTHLFEGVYGNAQSKAEAVKRIQATYQLELSDGLFFGDSALDGETANAFGIPFIYVSEYSDVSIEDMSHVQIEEVIKNFTTPNLYN